LFLAGMLGAVAVLFGAEFARQFGTLGARFGTGIQQWVTTLNLAPLQEFLNFADVAAAVPQFFSWGMTLGQAFLGAVLVFVGGLYMALDPDAYRRGLLKLVPADYQAKAVATLDDISDALRLWLGGVLVVMTLVAILTAVGLWLVGVESPILLGLLAGLANFVPYIGSIAAAVLTLIIAAAQGWEIMAWAAGTMFVIQQLEGNGITPVVIGRAVHIMPATGLFAIVAMTLLFGPLGGLFGFPLTIVADIAIRRLYILDTLDKPVEILGDPAAPSDAH
jgi:predicted PurR-regulated permease PerM